VVAVGHADRGSLREPARKPRPTTARLVGLGRQPRWVVARATGAAGRDRPDRSLWPQAHGRTAEAGSHDEVPGEPSPRFLAELCSLKSVAQLCGHVGFIAAQHSSSLCDLPACRSQQSAAYGLYVRSAVIPFNGME
jgi:hypothetical protein